MPNEDSMHLRVKRLHHVQYIYIRIGIRSSYINIYEIPDTYGIPVVPR